MEEEGRGVWVVKETERREGKEQAEIWEVLGRGGMEKL